MEYLARDGIDQVPVPRSGGKSNTSTQDRINTLRSKLPTLSLLDQIS